ncbi:hypothetical protein MSG28_014671 [Choristoneura fumiferana]|uniref:Uncharacterized protein n=1 Tax=Choristoneura fumiferana TaxID=7141 RepID=A0ACC0JSX5_CHOFU|nr:hypothetical protein MSG28_014671 [Choristoneura fumiferana]
MDAAAVRRASERRYLALALDRPYRKMRYLRLACAATRRRSLQSPAASPASSSAASASSRSSSRASSSSRDSVPADEHMEDAVSNASDETLTGDGFIVVTKKGKRKAISSSPTPNAPKQIRGSNSAPSQPYVAPRPRPRSRSPQQLPRSQRPPPIVIRDKSAWEAISRLAYERKLNFMKAVNATDGINVKTQDAESYRQMTRFLTQQGVAYHRYPFGEEKGLRVVVRGVPKELAVDAVKSDLIAQSLPVREVHRMYRARCKTPIDLVVVILDLSPEGKQIFNLKSVCHISGISVEPPHRRGTPGQCHRCQLYGHSARYCHAAPRCVKCTGDHGTIECPRPKVTEEPPSCTLCGTVGHTANYRGCPKAPSRVRRPVAWRPTRVPPKADGAHFPPLKHSPPRGMAKGSGTVPPPEGGTHKQTDRQQAPPPPPPPQGSAWSKPLGSNSKGPQPIPPPPGRNDKQTSDVFADISLVCDLVNTINIDEISALARVS